MNYTISDDIYYGCYGGYTYVRNVRDKMDYLYNEICFDVLEYFRVYGTHSPEELCGHLSGIYEIDSIEELSGDMDVFLKELEEAGIISADGKETEPAQENIRDFIQEICYEEHALLTVCLELTYRCNERCIHCYIDDPPDERLELTFSEYKKLLDDIRNMGCMGILLTGGEPTLHKDFLKIAYYAKKIGLMVDIYTNGFCMDDSMMDQLIRLKPNSVSFSFYGGTPQVHDAVTRAAGSFEKSLGTMMMCKCAGIDTFIKTVVMKQNFEAYEELLKLGKRLDIPVLAGLTVIPTHTGKQPEEFRLLDMEKYKKVLELEYQYGQSDKEMIVEERGDYVCASGLNALSIDPFGNIYPCNAHPSVLGNVRTDELEAVWNGSEILQSIRNLKFHQISRDCGSCEHKNWCGICLGNSCRENGHPGPCSDTCMIARASHMVYEAYKKT